MQLMNNERLNMKKLLLSFVVLLVTAIYVNAIPPAAPSVAAEKYVYSTVLKAANFDTLVGTDSTVLATKITIPAGSVYTLTRGPISGTGADSVALQVVVDCYDPNKAFIRRVVVDSVTSSTTTPGEDIAIPFFDSIFGSYFTIKLVPYGSTLNGGQVIMGSATLYSRKLYIETKQTVGSL